MDEFTSSKPFDCVIGRYVILHQADQVNFIRKAASLTKPGGALGFHEILLLDPVVESHPLALMWNRAGDWIVAAIRASAPASRLVKCFSDARLAPPSLFFASDLSVAGSNRSCITRRLRACAVFTPPSVHGSDLGGRGRLAHLCKVG